MMVLYLHQVLSKPNFISSFIPSFPSSLVLRYLLRKVFDIFVCPGGALAILCNGIHAGYSTMPVSVQLPHFLFRRSVSFFSNFFSTHQSQRPSQRMTMGECLNRGIVIFIHLFNHSFIHSFTLTLFWSLMPLPSP